MIPPGDGASVQRARAIEHDALFPKPPPQICAVQMTVQAGSRHGRTQLVNHTVVRLVERHIPVTQT